MTSYTQAHAIQSLIHTRSPKVARANNDERWARTCCWVGRCGGPPPGAAGGLGAAAAFDDLFLFLRLNLMGGDDYREGGQIREATKRNKREEAFFWKFSDHAFFPCRRYDPPGFGLTVGFEE
jgi:hypothetical protein